MKSGNFLLTIFLILCVSGCIPRGIDDVTIDEPQTLNLCDPITKDLETKPGIDGRLNPLCKGGGVYHFPISTKSELAQQYFDIGCLLNYESNYAEASCLFKGAIRQDPDCAMCFWGLGYVLGSCYNANMKDYLLPAAYEAVVNAKLRMHTASPKEKALIKALEKRYPNDRKETRFLYYETYAEAMNNVAKQFPMDTDIAMLTAEALIVLNAWEKNEKPHN